MLIWKKERPTKTGYYWTRYDKNDRGDIEYIDIERDIVLSGSHVETQRKFSESIEKEFAGPIARPVGRLVTIYYQDGNGDCRIITIDESDALESIKTLLDDGVYIMNYQAETRRD